MATSPNDRPAMLPFDDGVSLGVRRAGAYPRLLQTLDTGRGRGLRCSSPDRRDRDLGTDQRGAVYVEFLLVFIPVFTIFLGLIQASLMYAANIAVTHSATTAARAAAVVLDDNPKYYDDEPRNNVLGGGTPGGTAMDAIDEFLTWAGVGGAPAPSSATVTYRARGVRMAAIRSAASIPLLSFSPSMSALIRKPTVYRAIGGNPAERGLTGAAVYNRAAVAVTFPKSRREQEFAYEFEENQDVTVRVTYLFHCAVPLVNRIMCDDILSLKTGIPTEQIMEMIRRVASGASLSEIGAMLERIRLAQERLRASQPGMDELNAAESPSLIYLTALTGARYTVLRGEAVMPNHAANYTYKE